MAMIHVYARSHRAETLKDADPKWGDLEPLVYGEMIADYWAHCAQLVYREGCTLVVHCEGEPANPWHVDGMTGASAFAQLVEWQGAMHLIRSLPNFWQWTLSRALKGAA